MTKKKRTEIKKLLKKGKKAKYDLYLEFLKRIKSGDRLKPTELKAFNRLEKEIEAEHDESKNPDIVDSFDEAAAYCNVSKRTISYHIKRGNIKQEKDGTFLKKSLDKYLQSGSRRKPVGKEDVSGTDEEENRSIQAQKDEADLRLKNLRIERETVLLDQLKEKLISREDEDKKTAARVSAVTTGLESLSERLPPLLVGKKRIQMKKIIENEVRSLRENFAKKGEYVPAIK